jgi:RimJ/RimL family protein N-acetyltransferase
MEIKSNDAKIYLKTLAIEDADRFAAIANEQDISYNMADISRIPYPFTRRDAIAFIGLAMNSQMDNTGLNFGIIADNNLVGAVVIKLDLKNKTGEIGYWIGKEHRRKGYAREAIMLMLSFAFGTLKFNRVQAKTLATNDPSIKLLSLLGFTKEGVRRQRIYQKGKFIDDVIFSILSNEFGMQINYDVRE